MRASVRFALLAGPALTRGGLLIGSVNADKAMGILTVVAQDASPVPGATPKATRRKVGRVLSSGSGAIASFLQGLAASWLEPAHGKGNAPEPRWLTANARAFELSSVQLRDFSTRAGLAQDRLIAMVS